MIIQKSITWTVTEQTFREAKASAGTNSDEVWIAPRTDR